MNEQIKELAEQAGFGLRSDGEIYTATLEHLPITENMEKFAELIIHECATAMSKIPGGYSAEKYYESNQIIKQHFGVE